MAKIYGDRWEILESLASGGQADVFKVRDNKGEYTSQLVLKRVRNPKRHSRFRAEINAIKRLNHPNIVKIIDHSAMTENSEVIDKQFIVMPYANQGHLGSRIALYSDNIDSTVQVSKSLCLALQAAHKANIIHRDVKPENILFPTITHDIWLSDFGICLIRDQDRITSVDEVVGPIQFMAPELEGGGQLDVSPAADIYSFGKVIYYMLSGGVVIPRERLHDSEYQKIFHNGERHRLFENLLSRMICPLSSRIKSIDDVIIELERIESWERDARLLSIQPKTLSSIEEMKQKALEVRRKTEINAGVRAQRNAVMAMVSNGILDWFRVELEKTADIIRVDQIISADIRVVRTEEDGPPNLNRFVAGLAVELWFRNAYEVFQMEHIYRISIYRKSGLIVTSHVVMDRQSSMTIPSDEPEHIELMIVPSYGRKPIGASSNRSTDWRFFMDNNRLTQPAGQVRQPVARPMQNPQQNGSINIQAIQFSTADWPSVSEGFLGLFQQTVDIFISSSSTASGPFG